MFAGCGTAAGVYIGQDNAYFDKGNYDQAIADYTAALRINPMILMPTTNVPMRIPARGCMIWPLRTSTPLCGLLPTIQPVRQPGRNVLQQKRLQAYPRRLGAGVTAGPGL
ncbi:MAG: tetratricopeptide repeat protein [Treponema sp.]|nr:tetratricopeptide repeat protein [Treponema sp.]